MQQFEHTVSFVDQASTVTYWATFCRKDTGAWLFYRGTKIVSIAVHAGSGQSLVTTEDAHGFPLGKKIYIQDVEGENPSVEGEFTVVEVTSATSFKITASVTTAGARGVCGWKLPHYVREADVRSINVGRFNDQRDRDQDFYYA